MNLDLALEGCKKIIKVVGIDAQTFLDKTPHLILGILWQLVRSVQAKKINQRFKSSRNLLKTMTVELNAVDKKKEVEETRAVPEQIEPIKEEPKTSRSSITGQVTLEPG